MQILPTSTSFALDGYMASTSPSSSQPSGTSSFSQLFEKHAQAAPAEITPVIDTHTQLEKAEKSALSTTQAPYEEPSAKGAAGVRLTDKELKQVMDNLRKQGADQETLNKVASLMGNPLGVTVENLVKTLAGQQAAKLSEGDLARIESLSNTLDPSGQLSASLLDDLRNGRTLQAWNTFSQALQQADPAAAFSIDKNEILSFGKALGLTEGTLNAIDRTFVGQESGKFSVQGLQQLLVPAQQEMVTRLNSQEKLAQQLETALTPVVRQAQQRIADEASASSKQERQVQHSQTLIKDSMTENGFTRQPLNTGEEVARQVKTESVEASKTQVSQLRQPESGTPGGAATLSDAAATAIHGRQPQSDANADARSHGERQGKDAQTADTRDKGLNDLKGTTKTTESAAADKPASPWDALLQRISAQGVASTSTAQQAQNLQAQANAGTAANTQRPRMSEQLLSQVEQGVVTGFRDGSKTLQLQLNPVELGAMTILLSSHNGEVSATLRPERGETAIMLAQQTEHLKATLEQQGIKVDKVEVQTQLKDNQGNASNWQGLDQHNASQEQNARNDELERIRRLTRMGRISDSAVELARSARRAPTSAAMAGDGLHLVA